MSNVWNVKDSGRADAMGTIHAILHPVSQDDFEQNVKLPARDRALRDMQAMDKIEQELKAWTRTPWNKSTTVLEELVERIQEIVDEA